MLGGYLNRNNDPHPGHQIIWQGYTVLQYLSTGYMLAHDIYNNRRNDSG